MKDFLKGMAIITLALIIFPALPFVLSLNSADQVVPAVTENYSNVSGFVLIENVTIYDAVKQETFTTATEEYLTAALFANLQPDADPELIKAQAVILYTYILGRRADEVEDPTYDLHGADISTDSSKYLSIMLPDDAKMKYADEYETMRKMYESCISEVLGVYCTYDGEPIEPAFCLSSGGKTQSALTVLGEEVPYLRSVESDADKEFITEVTYTSAEVFARIAASGKGYTLYTDSSQWIKPATVTPDGYIIEIRLDNSYTVSGRWLASVLNLPSAKFSVTYSLPLDRFTFTVYGSGHLVGFSQNGANALAESGYSWQELLNHYYTDIDIVVP